METTRLDAPERNQRVLRCRSHTAMKYLPYIVVPVILIGASFHSYEAVQWAVIPAILLAGYFHTRGK